MNDTLKTKLLEQIDYFLTLSKEVLNTGGEWGHLDGAKFHEWKTGVENLIKKIAGERSDFYKDTLKNVRVCHISSVEAGIGILKGLKNALEQGLLGEIEDLVRAEVFTDFLETAEHLLERGHKDPAAFLVGTVLENGLRRIAGKHNVAVKDNDNIGSLNTKLSDSKVYNKLELSQIQSWKKIRDSANHGKFDEYKTHKVESMLEGVRRFLAEHLG